VCAHALYTHYLVQLVHKGFWVVRGWSKAGPRVVQDSLKNGNVLTPVEIELAAILARSEDRVSTQEEAVVRKNGKRRGRAQSLTRQLPLPPQGLAREALWDTW
jgi:hypothetical protein